MNQYEKALKDLEHWSYHLSWDQAKLVDDIARSRHVGIDQSLAWLVSGEVPALVDYIPPPPALLVG